MMDAIPAGMRTRCRGVRLDLVSSVSAILKNLTLLDVGLMHRLFAETLHALNISHKGSPVNLVIGGNFTRAAAS